MAVTIDGGSADTTAAAGTEAPGTEAPASEAPATGGGGTEGPLQGLKGTTPLVDLPQEFQDNLKAIDPALTDFNYAGETYDAVNIIALAAEKAKTDGIDYAKEINGITVTARSAPTSRPARPSSMPAGTRTTTGSPARWSSRQR